MPKTKMNLYFNGEVNEPYKNATFLTRYIENINGNEFRQIYPISYYKLDGSYQGLFVQFKVNNIGKFSRIVFNFKKDLNARPAIVIPKYQSDKINLYLDFEDGSVVNLNDLYAYTTGFIAKSDSTFDWEIKLNNIKSDYKKVNERTTLRINFLGVQPSTEFEPYDNAILDFKLSINSSYIEYFNNQLDTFSYSRTINSNNQIPNFGVYQCDGNVEIVDKNGYIEQRILTNTLNNNLTTDIYVNDTQVGKFVGVDGNYPYNEKVFNYSLEDYLSLFESIKIEPFILAEKSPRNQRYTASQLFYELIEKTQKYVEIRFETLNKRVDTYLSWFSFYDPYFECNNLKEMWEQFLIATMSSLFVNENGSIELDAYLIGKYESPIVVSAEKRNQDLQLNLITKNKISCVNVDYYDVEDNFSNILNKVITPSSSSEDREEYNEWLYQAFYHDYSTGPFTNEEIDFAIYGYYSGYDDMSKQRTCDYVLCEFEVNEPDCLFYGNTKLNVSLDSFNIEEKISRNDNIDFVIEFLNEEEYDVIQCGDTRETLNVAYVLYSENIANGKIKVKIPLLVSYFDNKNNDNFVTNINVSMSTQKRIRKTFTVGQPQPYKDTYNFQQSSLISLNSFYGEGTRIEQYLAETILNLYSNGRRTLSFSTNIYTFYDKNGIIKYHENSGELIRVGDIITFPDVLNGVQFKVTKTTINYDGEFTNEVEAIEHCSESSASNFNLDNESGFYSFYDTYYEENPERYE